MRIKFIMNLLVLFTLLTIVGCSNEEQQDYYLNTRLVNVNVTAVSGDSQTTRFKSTPITTTELNLEDGLSASVTITEDEIVQTRSKQNIFGAGLRFRMKVYNNTTLEANIEYEVTNTGAKILSGEGVVEMNGNKYLRLESGKTYRFVAYTDSTQVCPLDVPTNFSNIVDKGMNFSLDKKITEGDNSIPIVFRKIISGLRVILQTNSSSITNPENVILKNAPLSVDWDHLAQVPFFYSVKSKGEVEVPTNMDWTSINSLIDKMNVSISSPGVNLLPGATADEPLVLSIGKITVGAKIYYNKNITFGQLLMEQNKQYRVTVTLNKKIGDPTRTIKWLTVLGGFGSSTSLNDISWLYGYFYNPLVNIADFGTNGKCPFKNLTYDQINYSQINSTNLKELFGQYDIIFITGEKNLWDTATENMFVNYVKGKQSVILYECHDAANNKNMLNILPQLGYTFSTTRPGRSGLSWQSEPFPDGLFGKVTTATEKFTSYGATYNFPTWPTNAIVVSSNEGAVVDIWDPDTYMYVTGDDDHFVASTMIGLGVNSSNASSLSTQTFPNKQNLIFFANLMSFVIDNISSK